MLNFSPGDMLLFAKVAECRSMSAAARALKRPKASVSRAVARLEASLGVRLVERSSRHLALTEIGRTFLVHCKHVADELVEAEAAVGLMKGSVSGVLRVAVPLVFGRSVLAPILPRFMLAYPDLRVEIQISNRVVDPIEEGFDVVIRASPLEDSSLISRLLGEAFYAGYASPDYLARFEPLNHPQQLADHMLLDYFNGLDSRIMEFERDETVEKVKVRPRLDLNDAVIRRDAAIQGLGIAMLPSSICRDAVESGKLVQVLPEWTARRIVKLYALWPSRRNPSPRLRVFVDFLVREVPIELASDSITSTLP